MKIIFPNHPLQRNSMDPAFATEWVAAQAAGFGCELYSLEQLRAGNPEQAVQPCASATEANELLLHRGWMMSGELYAQFYAALRAKGYQPVATPEAYAQAHYLPQAYGLLEGLTPETRWVSGREVEAAMQMYADWSRPAAVVKDFVKSAKHRWREACFIPAGTEPGRLQEILQAFLEARGSQFERGIVLRRFHEFVTLAEDLRGQPVTEEYRWFFWDGRLLAAAPTLRQPGPEERQAEWEAIARRFGNRFLTLDIARQIDGRWLIVEAGDGGVSGLPDSISAEAFYRTLFERVQSEAKCS